jgi:transposase
MRRFTKEFKIECVKNYKKDGKFKTPEGWLKESFRKQIKDWVYLYDHFGGSAFDKKQPDLTYKEIVKICKEIEKGTPLKTVALSYGRSKATIRRYYKVYLQDGLAGLKLRLRNSKFRYCNNMNEIKIKKPETTDEINELESLKKKVEMQEIEIEYLKKLSALVQKRKAQQRKKK